MKCLPRKFEPSCCDPEITTIGLKYRLKYSSNPAINVAWQPATMWGLISIVKKSINVYISKKKKKKKKKKKSKTNPKSHMISNWSGSTTQENSRLPATTPNYNSQTEIQFKSTLRKHAYSNMLKILPPKFEKNQIKKFWYFFPISAQNIDCGYSLELPRRHGSNEYP